MKIISESKGDDGRNQYLLKRIKQNQELIHSDKLYLEKILDVEITKLSKKLQNKLKI